MAHRIETILDERTYEKFEAARGTIPKSAFLREMIHWTVSGDEEIEAMDRLSRKSR
jgi:hypothetical protein